MALQVDKLRIANILVEGNVPRRQAEELAEVITEALEPVATDNGVDEKLDSRFQIEVEPLRQDLEFTKVRTDEKFQAMLERSDQRLRDYEERMDQRFRDFEARMDQRFRDFEALMDQRFRDFEARMDQRFEAFEARMDQRFEAFEQKFTGELAALETRVDLKMERLKVQVLGGIAAATAILLTAISIWAAFG